MLSHLNFKRKLDSLGVKVFSRLFVFSAKYKKVGLAAFLFRIHTLLLHRSKNPPENKPIRVLILPKDTFLEDILSSLCVDGRFQIYSLNRMVIKSFATGILPTELDDNNYCSTSRIIERRKIEYRDFLKQVWQRIHQHVGYDAVLTGNFAYYAERELAAGLEELGMPFIVLHKENLKSPGRLDFFKEVYRRRRGPFLGRRILVYNEFERKVQIESGIVAPERVTVTGMPRLDRVHRWREQNAQKQLETQGSKRQVLFLFFGPKTGLPIMPRKFPTKAKGKYEQLGDEFDSLGWWNLVKHCYTAMVELARKAQDINIIIKVKYRWREIDALNELLRERPLLPKNLKIAKGGDALNYILESHVVCGFNSTGLIEAIAANKPVIVPWFDEAAEPKMQPYIVDLEDAVDYAGSPSDLIDLLLKHSSSLETAKPVTELSARRLRIVERWVGNPDGKAGQRVRDAVLEEIARSKC